MVIFCYNNKNLRERAWAHLGKNVNQQKVQLFFIAFVAVVEGVKRKKKFLSAVRHQLLRAAGTR